MVALCTTVKKKHDRGEMVLLVLDVASVRFRFLTDQLDDHPFEYHTVVEVS